MSDIRCTAVLSADGSRCGSAGVVRRFTSAYYPEGPELRLCRVHQRRYHQAALDVCNGRQPPEHLQRLAAHWRYEAP